MYRLLLGLFCLLPLSAFAGGLLGIAYVDNIVGLNLEWATSQSSFYVVPGVRVNQSTGGAQKTSVRFVAGMRHRLDKGGMDDDGFFVGLIGGDLGGSADHRRNGYGGELGYQLVAKYTRWTVSGGLVVLDADKSRNLNNEPAAVLGVSISLRK
jgi:hypothetical protein